MTLTDDELLRLARRLERSLSADRERRRQAIRRLIRRRARLMQQVKRSGIFPILIR